MKSLILLILIILASGCTAQSVIDASSENKPILIESVISKSNWIRGSSDCDDNSDSSLDSYQHDEDTFIIRQNKCLTFEAPFIYVLVGEQKILILDTGALSDTAEFSFRSELANIVGKDQFTDKELLIVHSHGHGDHYVGDDSFEGMSNVTLVKPSADAVREYFGFSDWPNGQKIIDLGGRKITVFPTPGHQEEAITLYDEKNNWLLTGDTLYPGLIYIKDWQRYQKSIDKIATFATNNKVTAIMGAHIEMKKQPGEYYEIGSTYQPDEANLALSVHSLSNLNAKLQTVDEPAEMIFDEFIIMPMGGVQKSLSNLVRWFKQ